MVVVSEFVGCSPSVSGAIRVNPWSIDSVADGIYTAIQMPAGDRHLRHEKHWRYISGHTVGYWAQVTSIARSSGCNTQQATAGPFNQCYPTTVFQAHFV
jgi:trehalose-6-phosphate synthase